MKIIDIEGTCGIGTRIIVTMPQRITDELMEIFGKYHELGTRESSIVTHFEHPTEIAPDSLPAITSNTVNYIGLIKWNGG